MFVTVKFSFSCMKVCFECVLAMYLTFVFPYITHSYSVLNFKTHLSIDCNFEEKKMRLEFSFNMDRQPSAFRDVK